MDKNTITGFILILAVLLGFNYFSRPSEEQIRQQQIQDSLTTVAREQAEALQTELKQKEELTRKALSALDSTTMFYAQRTGEGTTVILQNEVVELKLNTKGGSIEQATLKDYKNQQGEPVTLFDAQDARMKFMWAGKNENIDTEDYVFMPVAQSDSSVIMRLQTAEGGTLDLIYKLRPHSYMVDFTIRTSGLANYFPPALKTMDIEWTDNARQQEKGFDFENRYASLTYKIKEEGIDNLSETKEDTKDVPEALDWIAFKNQFFSCVIIGHQDFTNTSLSSVPRTKASGYLKDYSATMQTAFDPSGKEPTVMQFYFGPNNYHLLQETNHLTAGKKDLELEGLVYLGWPLVKWINRWFIIYIFDWLSSWGLPMGVVLLLLTLLVKLLVYPTTKKSYMSSAKMRVLKPKIDEISAKYPKQEDAMKKQQEIMQLYSRYGVSPMGGCLPMLIQMPIWIALFNFVPNAIELRGQSFLWADDLSAYDDVIHWSKDLWLIGDHLSIFCVLFCLTNIINTWISMRQQQNSMTGEQAQQMKMMQYMMYIMPLMFFFMFNNYSSGLNYYYFLSGLSSVLIMWFLRKTTDDRKLLEKLEANYKANLNNPKKMSGMAARLEALQKQQQAMLEEQKRRKQK
ncbi:MAG: membrane protein insertase YidC [Paraprevotella sp.]|nr:membrane protein insertase YidC [Paraprevotella sp.]